MADTPSAPTAEMLPSEARRAVGKWLNECPQNAPDLRDIAELCADYDRLAALARSEPATGEMLAQRLRASCEKLRRTPMPIADLIPLLQQAADALARSEPATGEPVADSPDGNKGYDFPSFVAGWAHSEKERNALAAEARAPVAMPEGWKAVPIERSYDMRVRAILHFNTAEKTGDRDDALQAAWEAMLAAAPPIEAQAGEPEGMVTLPAPIRVWEADVAAAPAMTPEQRTFAADWWRKGWAAASAQAGEPKPPKEERIGSPDPESYNYDPRLFYGQPKEIDK